MSHIITYHYDLFENTFSNSFSHAVHVLSLKVDMIMTKVLVIYISNLIDVIVINTFSTYSKTWR